MDAFAELLQTFAFQGATYTIPGARQEELGGDLRGMNRAGYQSSAVVFACIDVRAKLFSEARFAYRRRRSGRPGGLFTRDSLRLLERPWPGGTKFWCGRRRMYCSRRVQRSAELERARGATSVEVPCWRVRFW